MTTHSHTQLQARLDVEPLVLSDTLPLPLESLGARLRARVTRLSLCDASFTRRPWRLDGLAGLPELQDLSVTWDAALWAPGQVLVEGAALAPLFSLSRLTALELDKGARLTLGEIGLGDAALAAAGALPRLARLRVSGLRASDMGAAALGGLTRLTHLGLQGQLAVSLNGLSAALLRLQHLQELELGVLVAGSADLRAIADAAAAGLEGVAGTGGSSDSRNQGRDGSAARRRMLRRQLREQRALQRRLLLPPHSPGGSREHRGSSATTTAPSTAPILTLGQPRRSAASGSSPRPPPTLHTLHAPHAARSVSASVALPQARLRADGSPSSSSSAASSGGHSANISLAAPGPPAAAATALPMPPLFSSPDWTEVLAPLRSLRHLVLHSDLALLGSCAALRSLPALQHVELRTTGRFLDGVRQQALPQSWLSALARGGSRHSSGSGSSSSIHNTRGSGWPAGWPAEAAGMRRAFGSSAGSSVQHGGRPQYDGAAEAPQGGLSGSTLKLVRVGGAWPALAALQIDNLQHAEAVLEGAARLASLRTLLLSGPCLLTQPVPFPAGGLELPPATAGAHAAAAAAAQLQPAAPTAGWRPAPWPPALAAPSHSAAAVPAAAPLTVLPPLRAVTAAQHLPISSAGSSPAPCASAGGAAVAPMAPRPLVSTTSMPLASIAAVTAGAGQVSLTHTPAAAMLLPDRDMLTRLSPLEQLQRFELCRPSHHSCGE